MSDLHYEKVALIFRFEPVSFVSSKNKKVKNVQFVIKTESIKKEEDKQEDKQKEAEEKERSGVGYSIVQIVP
ncbi:hypothetical protein [Halobacillus ihumii]|uniref:hypothetical protein n=1 Tax=Halobacillus ihumii TaxID=2686092 RepID=UPI0013D84684|nr:hypothetical protein [Halobacillus ihumii]